MNRLPSWRERQALRSELVFWRRSTALIEWIRTHGVRMFVRRIAAALGDLGETAVCWLRLPIRSFVGHLGLLNPQRSPLIISNLRYHRKAIATVASWLFEEWGNELWTREAIEEYLAKTTDSRTLLPSTYLGIRNNQPVGAVSLVKCDLPIRPQYTPWIASVIVPKEYRGQGIGRRLVRFAERKLLARGWSKAYIYTRDKDRMYARMGYQLIERTRHMEWEISVMRKSL